MGELRPLGAGLTNESRAFAEALRQLFAGLEVSVRRYAARRYRDAGTLSRYLSGTRIPPWEFVVDLFQDVAEHHRAAPTPQAMSLMRELHRAAVQTGGSASHAMDLLQTQLAQADREARRSTVQEEALSEVLLDRKHRIADLQVRLNRMEAAWADGQRSADAVELHLKDREQLTQERDMLLSEVQRLTEELEVARQRALLAESRCELLERQLATVEEQQSTVRRAGEPEPGPRPDSGAAPAMVPEPAAVADVPAPHRLRAPAGPQPRILIVDDQPNNLLALSEVLSALHYEIVAATSGTEALKALLEQDDFAVILLDVQMPDMDGYETAAHIKRRARTRHIPIIFLTAMGSDSEHATRGYAAGAVDYIAKPFDPWALRAKVSVFTEMFIERVSYGQREEADAPRGTADKPPIEQELDQ
ncbi:response regulator [Wenjunlia tyrosinilytica]|uniref:Response regulatory domain-containing protein n=1 Tax=Wenjunlia tyrosinilytica TaxID=1544741 RepID=A0A917ZRT2_9ACTN|nr:response regulator [Wenjunlia tyrosinilytica]GGO90120.1 hypothetical protein GCM10012280_34910 [Wenjunlia tyrosinilytica]